MFKFATLCLSSSRSAFSCRRVRFGSKDAGVLGCEKSIIMPEIASHLYLLVSCDHDQPYLEVEESPSEMHLRTKYQLAGRYLIIAAYGQFRPAKIFLQKTHDVNHQFFIDSKCVVFNKKLWVFWGLIHIIPRVRTPPPYDTV